MKNDKVIVWSKYTWDSMFRVEVRHFAQAACGLRGIKSLGGRASGISVAVTLKSISKLHARSGDHWMTGLKPEGFSFADCLNAFK